MYPDDPTVEHWKSRAYGLCKKYTELNIDPLSKNNYQSRLKILMNGVEEILDPDYGAIENHFKTVKAYYDSRPKPHERLKPYSGWKENHANDVERVKSGIITLTEYTAKQDYESMINYMMDEF